MLPSNFMLKFRRIHFKWPLLSLRWKLSLAIIGVLAIGLAVSTTMTLRKHRQIRLTEAIQHSDRLTLMIASSLVQQLGHFPIYHHQVIDTFEVFIQAAFAYKRQSSHLAFALLVDPTGKVIAGQMRHNLFEQPTTLQNLAQKNFNLPTNMWRRRFPLVASSNQAKLGSVIVGTSLTGIERAIQRDFMMSFIALSLGLLALLAYSSIALRLIVIKPINQLILAINQVRKGDLSAEIKYATRDEFSQLGQTYNYMLQGLRERKKLQNAFERYVSPHVYERLQQKTLTLGGETRIATILFVDIRNFTSLSQHLAPSDTIAQLNDYFTAMVDVVFAHHGYVNKFIGDALMAVYNAPLEQPQPELKAVQTALAMLQTLKKINLKRQEQGEPSLKIGIGINTGPVVAGNLGHEKRLEYTVIGNAVNLAQRLEEQTKIQGHPILIAESTYLPIAKDINATRLSTRQLRGHQTPLSIYAVHHLTTTATKITSKRQSPMRVGISPTQIYQ